jgi:sortase A
MARKVRPQDLSEEELRYLLREKRREARRKRLDAFRRTGRLVILNPNKEENLLDDFPSSVLDDQEFDKKPRRTLGRRIFNALLLLVEVTAIVGLVFLLFNGASIVQELNQEVAAALEQPTMTPTPLIRALVLPSGHTPPDSLGGARPNESEIPEHLRPLVSSLGEISIPTPSPEQAVSIQISAIDVYAPVRQGDSWEQLKAGVGQHIGTANPGQAGNMVLSAHNDIYGQIFRYLDQLSPGDEVVVFSNIRSYTYVVTNIQVVEPTYTQVMEPSRDGTLTLISCYPYLVDDKRIIVKASFQGDS